MLDTWPPLPIDIWVHYVDLRFRGVDNIVAALEHNDRIHKIELRAHFSSIFYEKQALAAMQKPFPSLTELAVHYIDDTSALVVPDLFLSGSAPLLRSLRLTSIEFPLPVLRNLLLSATDLVEIRISTRDFKFLSPEEVVACPSALTRLEEFELEFRYLHCLGSQRPPPSTRCVLPALISLQFKGVYEYMEDLIARIDAPQLDSLKLFLFDQHVLGIPQLAQFIGRTPRFKALNELHILLDGRGIFVLLPWIRRRGLQFGVLRAPPDQLSVLVKLYTSYFLRALIPIVKHLYIRESRSPLLYWRESIETANG